MWSLVAAIIVSGTINAYAASERSSKHVDHRSAFKKLEFVTDSQTTTLHNAGLYGEDVALNYLEENAADYGLQAGLSNLKLVEVKESLLGSHFHFQQMLNGYPVRHGEIVVSVSNKTNSVSKVFNNTYPVDASFNQQLSLKANKKKFSKDEAIGIAWKDLKVHGKLRAAPKGELVYVPDGTDFRLAHVVDIGSSAPFGHFQHMIDAYTGEIFDIKRTEISRKPVTIPDYKSYKGKTWDRKKTVDEFKAKESKKAALEQEITSVSLLAGGTGNVFDPDPVTTLQNSSLEDTSSASSFSAAYVTRTLQDITLSNGTYSLTGPWITIADFESPSTAPSTTTSGNWTATRGSNSFNDAMTYFHVDQNQRYLQSLGFTGSTAIQDGSIYTDTDGVNGDDNSHFVPSTNRMAFGHGCVDDNEDSFVILHEYWHAIQHDIVGNNWSGGDTGAMGEGFGDYWGGSYRISTPNGLSFNPAWAFPWDGHNNCWGGRNMDVFTAQYDHATTYSAHQNLGGYQSDELFGTPIFQALLTLVGQGVDREEVDQIILESQFGLGYGLKMREMASIIVTTAETLFPSGNHADVFQAKFEVHNILVASSGNETTENFSDSITEGAWKHYGPFDTETGTQLSAVMSGGSGDPDLYVKVGSQPTSSSYDCRPYKTGTGESCTVNAGGDVYVSVYGYRAGSYDLAVTYTPADGGGGTSPQTDIISDSVASDEMKQYTPYTVTAGKTFSAVMTGTGDPDLFVRFGAQPTTSTYDCRPYAGGASETCDLTVPSGQTQAYVAVRGYTAGTYSITVTYE